MTLRFSHASIALALLVASGGAAAEGLRIGFSIDSIFVKRWERDRGFFIAAAKEFGTEGLVESAGGNEQKQVSQIENLIARGVKAMAIIPSNPMILTSIVGDAKAAGVKIIAYDRLILKADIDAFITIDTKHIGALQAKSLINVAPKGNYLLLGGDSGDPTAKFLRAGQMEALKPFVDKGDIRIVGEKWVAGWSPMNALAAVENGLTAAKNAIDAIVSSNDAMAAGAVQALAAQKLDGKVAVSGLDADLDAVQRILSGTQTTTVYIPQKLLATEAARVAVQLARGEAPAFNAKSDNGRKMVDTLYLEPVVLDKANIDRVVQDGRYTKEEVYGR